MTHEPSKGKMDTGSALGRIVKMLRKISCFVESNEKLTGSGLRFLRLSHGFGSWQLFNAFGHRIQNLRQIPPSVRTPSIGGDGGPTGGASFADASLEWRPDRMEGPGRDVESRNGAQ